MKRVDKDYSLINHVHSFEREYWLDKIYNVVNDVSFPYDYNTPRDKVDTINLSFPEDISNALNKFSKNKDLSLYIILVTCLNILLLKYTTNEDITIGSPVYNKHNAENNNTQLVALRNQLTDDMTFKEILLNVRKNTLEAYENQNYSISNILEDYKKYNNYKINNLFSVICCLENIHNKLNVDIKEYKVVIIFRKEKNNISINVNYNEKYYCSNTIHTILKSLAHIIQQISANTDIKVSELELISDNEKDRIMNEFNNTRFRYQAKTIIDLFEEQVLKKTEEVAVICKEDKLTYSELNGRANQLGRYLRHKGVKQDCLVAISMDRSIDMIVGIISILKAGGAYVPIDPQYPIERIKLMIEDSKSVLLLTQTTIRNKFDSIKSKDSLFDIVCIDEDIYEGDTNNLKTINQINDLAYVIYTSGTTGMPKGVMIEHRNVHNLILGLYEKIYKYYNYTLKVCMVSPFCFDASVKQIFATLLLGHTLYIVPDIDRRDGIKLLSYYKNNGIDISDGTPAHLRMITDLAENIGFQHEVKHFIIGGESLKLDSTKKIFNNCIYKNMKITNVYGPTECCVDNTSFELDSQNINRYNKIPIGKPMLNHKIVILDAHHKMQPIGVIGELCISGDGVGRGYLNRAELTNEKFINLAIMDNKKVYKTGDQARWLPDGNIEYIGRIDNQVKIRGYRIELEEIENLINHHNSIKEAVVVNRPNKHGEDCICSYLSIEEDDNINAYNVEGNISLLVNNYDKIAIKDKNSEITYFELFNHVHQLALHIHKLMHSKYQLEKKDIKGCVALVCDNNISIIVGAIGAIQSGSDFIQIDTDDSQKILHIIRESKLKVLVADDNNISKAIKIQSMSELPLTVINIDDIELNLKNELKLFENMLKEIKKVLAQVNFADKVLKLHGNKNKPWLLKSIYNMLLSGTTFYIHEFDKREAIISELKGYLISKIPDYMIPTYFTIIDKIPFTSNGKVNKKALPTPHVNLYKNTSYMVPRNEVEVILLKIWKKLLDINAKISITDDFFILGGNSLKATTLISKIHKWLDVQIPLLEIFKNPTIEKMAKYIQNTKKSKLEKIERIGIKQYYSLSSSQKRLYMMNEANKKSINYNMPLILEIEGNLNNQLLKNVFNKLVERHEVFRTSFHVTEGQLTQKIHQNVCFNICFMSVNNEEEIDERIRSFIKPFDLMKAPLIRVGVIQKSKRKQYLIIDMHHIICDGVSISILISEFNMIYNGKKLESKELQYKDYAEWHNKFLESDQVKKQEKYWQDVFSQDVVAVNMPLDFRRKKNKNMKGKTIFCSILKETTDKLIDFTMENKITLNTLLFSIYNILISKYSDQFDLVIGSLVAGRRHNDVENVIGMFANYLPIRSHFSEEDNLKRIIDIVNCSLTNAFDNQDYPFEKIVENFDSIKHPHRNPLFDSMFIFHNQYDSKHKLDVNGVNFNTYQLEFGIVTLDLKFDVYIDDKGSLCINLQYNTELFKEETIIKLKEDYVKIMNQVLVNPNQKLMDFNLFSKIEKEQLDKRKQLNDPIDEKELEIVINASFTSDIIEKYISWWGKQVNLNLAVKLAPYNQVFQQLLDDNSITSNNRGINVILVRLEDWIRFDNASVEEKVEKLETYTEKFLAAIVNKNKCIPYFIGIFPISYQVEEKMGRYLKSLYERISIGLRGIDNVYLIDFRQLHLLYNIDKIYDLKTDKMAHIPYTEEFYAAMGTFIVRKINAIFNNKYKVIVLDCDNTIWGGICGEDTPSEIKIDPYYSEIQEFFIQKQNEGMLLTLCSKNNEKDVWNVFEKNKQMRLKKSHFVNSRINWDFKSKNIIEMAQELDLGMDSFIFIDDNAMECAEVMEACPEIVILKMPENPKEAIMYLKHIWELDIPKTTSVDKIRSNLYQDQKKRQELQNKCESLDEFIQKLNLKVVLELASDKQVSRISQLTYRTNQFNLSTIRRSESQIKELMKQQDVICWTISVKDVFGDYGLTGVIIAIQKKDILFLDTLLLSCRVLGKKVEQIVLEKLISFCKDSNLNRLACEFYPNDRNIPIKKFIQESNWEIVDQKDDYIHYEINIL